MRRARETALGNEGGPHWRTESMPKEHRPRHGSMGFSPRKRSESPIPHFSSWPEIDGAPKLQGFAGYKAGMTHAFVVDYRPTSTTSGQEVQIPVTVIETPPMKVAAIRVYRNSPYGLQVAGEAWAKTLDKELRRVFPIPKDHDPDEAFGKIDAPTLEDVRVITYTQPDLVTGIPKKAPELMEQRVGGGTIPERLAYAKSLVGEESRGSHFCMEGLKGGNVPLQKGKGWEGHHDRWPPDPPSPKNSQ